LLYRTFRTIRILFHALFAHLVPPATHFPPCPSVHGYLTVLNSPFWRPTSFVLFAGHADMAGQCIEIHFISVRWQIRLATGKIRVTASVGERDGRWAAERDRDRDRDRAHWRVLTVIIQWYLTADIAGQGHHHSCGMFGFAFAVVNGSIYHPRLATTFPREDQGTLRKKWEQMQSNKCWVPPGWLF